MRNIRTRRAIILILTGLAIALAIGIYAVVPTGVSSMEIVNDEGERIEEELNMFVGAETQIGCKVSPAFFSDRKTYYSVSDESVASVDENGLIKALKKGETLLTIQHAGEHKSIKVAVQPSVKEIRGLPEEVTLLEGDGYLLEPEVIMADKNLEAPEVTFKSKRTTIATVDEDGQILAGEIGNTTVTVKAGPLKVKIPITVIERPLSRAADDGV